MPQEPTPSERTPRIADAPPDNWVDQYAPEYARPYLRLARLDRPIGIWLLLLPCWWGVGLAEVSRESPYPDLWLLVLFAVGALVMRAAGCAYNDFVDRDYDAKVSRTASRPIPSGQITPGAALAFAAVCSFAGLMVLIQFNAFTIRLGAASMILVAIYPFLKRYTYWPQIALGLAFNWGALVGWSAVTGGLGLPAVLLYCGSVLWTVGYATIYAYQDKEDDLMLGLKSTAIRFGANTMSRVGGLYAGAAVLWFLAGLLAGTHFIYFTAVLLVSAQMAWQVTTLDITDTQNCLARFRSNRDAGLVIFLGLVTDMGLFWLVGSS
ncbi:MAG: 4-hydroxybenzoate octaprenyltransferase [Hyphomicrobium sp.]